MTNPDSTHVTSEDATVANRPGANQLNNLAECIRSQWSQGHSVSLASYIKQNSQLCSDHSLVIDLAIDEYRLRRSLGQESSVEQFCKSFAFLDSALQSSIFRQIEVQKYFDKQIEWPNAGDHISDYRILEELGRGALARVYLCSQSTLGDRQVVVKISRRGTQEGQTLGRLQHPHIMPIHSLNVEGDQELSYLCTPFLGRSTLRDLISKAFATQAPSSADIILEASNAWITENDCVASNAPSIPYKGVSYVAGILQLGIKLCEALEYAHSIGIFHGDLKPSNILLTPGGAPILLDFNLARDDELTMNVQGGTLMYMAPEEISRLLLQDCGNEKSCNQQSEIYSLGVVLYELLSGRLPFDTDEKLSEHLSLPEEMLAQQELGAPSLAVNNPDVDRRLAAKLNRCLAFDPKDRYHAMAELRIALQDELTAARGFHRWTNKHRSLTLAFSICLSILLIGFGTWLINRSPYQVRQYYAGIAHQERGDLELAKTAFERAIRAKPDYLEAKFAAANIYLLSGEIDVAQKKFIQLVQAHDHPPSMAQVGYCFNLKKQHSLAIPWYEKAIQSEFKTAEVHNNLAVSYELGNTTSTLKDRLLQAEPHLEMAIQEKPDSPTILFNIVHVDHICSMRDEQYIPKRGLLKLKKLLSLESESSYAYNLVPWLYAKIAIEKKAILDEAMDLLISACRRDIKIDTKPLREESRLILFRRHARFDELLQAATKVEAIKQVGTPRFLNPNARH